MRFTINGWVPLFGFIVFPVTMEIKIANPIKISGIPIANLLMSILLSCLYAGGIRLLCGWSWRGGARRWRCLVFCKSFANFHQCC